MCVRARCENRATGVTLEKFEHQDIPGLLGPGVPLELLESAAREVLAARLDTWDTGVLRWGRQQLHTTTQEHGYARCVYMCILGAG